jgi:hypothetical protein
VESIKEAKSGNDPGKGAVAMKRKQGRLLTVFAVVTIAAGCATQQQQLTTKQPTAVDTALARGRFDLNCPSATATVLSQDYIQPAIQGPWASGLTRLEYTVGIAGCNQRTTVIVICQEGSTTCFAANPDSRFRGQ